MKMILPLGLLAGLLCYASVSAQSGVPSEMSYQATVTDENGNLIAPGTSLDHEIIVRIWNSATGGQIVWSEKQTVPVSDGRFSLILGEGVRVPITGGGLELRPNLDTIFSEANLFTEITLTEDGSDESTTLLPRQKLVASSTAMRAKVAEGLVEGGLNLAAIPDGSLTANKIKAGTLTSAQIQNDSITNADLSAAANISATKLGTGAIDNTEFNYLNGLTSGIQSQLNGKARLSGENFFSGGEQNFNVDGGLLRSFGGVWGPSNLRLPHLELQLGRQGPGELQWDTRIASNTDSGGGYFLSFELPGNGSPEGGIDHNSILKLYRDRIVVNGDARKTGGGSWTTISDARVKQDISTVTNALDTLNKVRLVSFRYSDDYRLTHPSIKDKLHLNVIAQEFREVFPTAVTNTGELLPDGSEILQVDPYPLTVYSAAAIQELSKRVGTAASITTARMERLEKENADLLRKLAALETREKARDAKLASLKSLLSGDSVPVTATSK